MFSEIQKDFSLKGKTEKEALAQWLLERQWSQEYVWHGQKHASCKHKRPGTWRVTGYGFYQASDWNWYWFLGHRCSTCGTMVQHRQLANAEGTENNPITRSVVIP